VIARESSFKPRARNREDLGLMQVNRRYHPDLIERAGGPQAMMDPEKNLQAGIRLLARYRRMSADELEALQRYHGLGKNNGYVQRVTAEARRMREAGACLPAPTSIAMK
jgi:soluble lytic murein transglycosylase-like protein